MGLTGDHVVAVVGVGAIMPDAPDAATFWSNIRNGRYSITDVPPERWDPDLYWDPDPSVPDKTYSKIGGWVREFPWDPLRWKMPIPPKTDQQIDEGQKWAIACSREALLDAGWPERPLDTERTAVVLGNAMAGEKHYATALKIYFPEFARELAASPAFAALPADVRDTVMTEAHDRFVGMTPDITEDTMPGELGNILAGRVANLLDLQGPNYIVDAACASALASGEGAIQGLLNREYDAVLTGGIDRNMGVPAFVKFCKIGALSASGTRPYAEGADGFVMGEGGAVFLLKRLADAERDGDRIYAVICGLGGASDGKGKGITAPNPKGQRLAVERAWAAAGLDPRTAGYVEGHGTSTAVGDVVEVEALTAAFGDPDMPAGSIPLGSVKSNIGHLKAAAGAAGLFKTIMALHDKVLPPSLNWERPNPRLDWSTSPFTVNTELREWPAGTDGVRRAGVSAFGFGGTNFHVVLEEYVPGRWDSRRQVSVADVPDRISSIRAGGPATTQGDTPQIATNGQRHPGKPPLRGLAVLGADSRADLARQVDELRARAEAGDAPSPAEPDRALAGAPLRLAADFADAADLAAKLDRASKALANGNDAVWRMLKSQGVFLGEGAPPPTAFLYTGQGSQYVNMCKDLVAVEPIVRDTFEEADRIMTPLLGRPLTDYIFIDADDPDAVARLEQQLLQTEITQPAVLATDLALTRMLAAYGIAPDMVMGHSLGEYGALVAAGALSFEAALEAVSARGSEMAHLSVEDNGAMAAVFAPLPEIERIVAATDGYAVIANVNSNNQAVVGGATAAVQQAVATFQAEGHTAVLLPVSHAFHTSIVAPASEPLKVALRRLDLRPPVLPIVANVDGGFYPTAGTREELVEQMLDILGRQVASPVQFVEGLHTLYDAGARTFVEVGPKRALHGFVEDVLGSEHEDVLSLYTNHPKTGGVVSFNQALAGLYAAGYGLATAPSEPSHPTGAVGAPPTATAEPSYPTVSPGATSTTGPTTTAGTTMSSDVYTQLGHLFADFLDRGRAIYEGGAAPAPAVGGALQGPGPMSSDGIVVSGVGLGLPGVEKVFDEENLAKLLNGESFIELIPAKIRQRIAEMHITRLVKSEDGNHRFDAIDDPREVIKLAGRHAPLDLAAEYGLEQDRVDTFDATTELAVAAGFDALRDAGIPLVQHYKTTSVGSKLPAGWRLPDAIRDDVGVIFASAFPGMDELFSDLEHYYTDKARRDELEHLRTLRARMDGDRSAPEVDRRIGELEHLLRSEPFRFDRRFLFRVLSFAHAQFAELIGARGPNTQLNAACASTTQAVGIAEDWIRAGRCRYVVVIGADDVTSDNLLPWVGGGFLASGAAATDDVVEEAALPFDNRRHGMLLGMGAAALVVESADAVRERGINPICEVVSTVIGNSAFHGTRLDVGHIRYVMDRLMRQAEARGLDRNAIAPKTVFVSHETYTPARGGSAAAEVNALRHVFGDRADDVVIANTKGYTGHAMGAGVEDVLAVRALETGIVPPIPNFRDPDPELGALNLSKGGAHDVDYALRLAAGFGSQISLALFRWTPMPDGRRRAPHEVGFRSRMLDEAAWTQWLARMSGQTDPQVEVDHRKLRVIDRGPEAVRTDVAAPTPTTVATPAPAAAPGLVPDVAPPAAATEDAHPAMATDAAPTTAAPTPEPAAPPADPVADRVVAMVSELTGYPPDLLDPELDLEADLGVDTVKQAEVFAALRDEYAIERDDSLKLRDFPTLNHVIGFVRDRASVDLPAPAPATTPVTAETVPAAPTVPDAAAAAGEAADPVAAQVVETVAELTGYPPDLLDLDLDLEADLGVDTVKQAEVFATLRDTYGIERDDSLKLRDFPTLNHVIGFVRDRATVGLPEDAIGPAAAPETPGAEASEPTGDGDPVTSQVVETVAELTGYPPDLLDLDLDLEADLGVDTVKQAEVFATLREIYGIPRDDSLKLRDFPTLNHVIGFVRERATTGLGAAAAAATGADTGAAPTPVAGPAGDISATDVIPRRIPVPVRRPALDVCVPTGVELGAGSRVLVMPDSGGVADALLGRLEKLDVTVKVLDPHAHTDAIVTEATAFAGDGGVQGVFWLPALDDTDDLADMDLATWREALRVRVKALHAVMRALYEDVATDTDFLVSATRLGGMHGYDDGGATAPLGGAVVGFTKSYKREREDVLVKAVDFPPSRKTASFADLLIDETTRDPGVVEVGHTDDARWTVGLREVPFDDAQGDGMALTPDTVFVVTGAAGSIVSAIVADLAAASGGTFHLLDLTPEPDPDDEDLAAYAADPEALKTTIADRMKAAGERPTPVLIGKELARLERLHAAQSAIRAVEEAGGTAHYHSVDLTDADGVDAVMERVRAVSGRIDVLLHAGGLEISHALPDKPAEQFALVFDVKADGWFNVLHGAGELPIGATVCFSSIAGRFGNAGQTDYAAANDLLCKTTSSFRRTRPDTRGLVLDWTAWGGIGMATRGSIPKVMEMAGIDMLPPEAGIPWIRRELTASGHTGEVLVAGSLGVMGRPFHRTGGLDVESVETGDAGPMVGRLVSAGVDGSVTVEVDLDPIRQGFLDDHRIDGTPVLPGVMGMEAFAEAARVVAPDLHVVAVEDVTFAAPFKFYRDEPRTVRVVVQLRQDGDDVVADCRLEGERSLATADDVMITTHFTGRVRLTAETPEPPMAEVPPGPADGSLSPDELYAVYFHGPAYQVVAAAWRADGEQRCVTRFADDLPANHAGGAPTLTTPRLVELCFQTAGVWEIGTTGRMALPEGIDRVEFFGTAGEGGELYAVSTPTDDGADVFVVDGDGRVRVRMTGYRTVELPVPVQDDLRAPLAAAIA